MSGLVNEDLGAVELGAVRDLLRLRKSGRITLVTGAITAEEIGRLSPSVRARHEDLYLLLDDVPVAAEQVRNPYLQTSLAATSSRIYGPPTVKVRELGQLLGILRDPDDARHIFQAYKSGVDYFITCDVRTIIKHSPKIEAIVSLRIRTPSQVLGEIHATS